MILVYCNQLTERHRFIFGFILGDILNVEFKLTDSKDDFHAFQGVKLSYGEEISGSRIHFASCSLLSEQEVVQQKISILKWKELPVFFETDGNTAWLFDPFALAFYLVTRYEEYLPFEPDEHGRFTARQSLAFRETFLNMPLIDLLALELKKLILEKFPGFVFPDRCFRFIPTFDVDIAYAHLGKGPARATLAWIKLMLQGDFRQIRERMTVIRGRMPDPYDNFDLHLELVENYGHSLKYFFLLGDFGQYDRNLSYKNKRFRELIRRLSRSAVTGIHPSYRSFLDPDQFKKEKSRLEEITGNQVTLSRFHFLRMKFPDSLRMLNEFGVMDDYSMGYSDINGFRAGTCTPFYFYDLLKEEKTNLRIHPFIFMDSAMIDHLKYSPEQAEDEITGLIEMVSKTGGDAIGIWHNYSLSETGQYKGWRQILAAVLARYKNLSS